MFWQFSKYICFLNVADEGGGNSSPVYVPPPQPVIVNSPVISDQPISVQTPSQPVSPLVNYDAIVAVDSVYSPVVQNTSYNQPTPTTALPPTGSINYYNVVPQPITTRVVDAPTFTPEMYTPTIQPQAPVSIQPDVYSSDIETLQQSGVSQQALERMYSPTPPTTVYTPPLSIVEPQVLDYSVIGAGGDISSMYYTPTPGLYQPKLTPEFIQTEKDLVQQRAETYTRDVDAYNKQVSDYQTKLDALDIPSVNADVELFKKTWADKIDSSGNFTGTEQEWNNYTTEYNTIIGKATKVQKGFADLSMPSIYTPLALNTEQAGLKSWVDKLNTDVEKYNTNLTPTASGMYPPGFIGPPIPGAKQFDLEEYAKDNPMNIQDFENLYFKSQNINPVDPMMRQSDFIKPGTLWSDPKAEQGRQEQLAAHDIWVKTMNESTDFYNKIYGSGTYAQTVGAGFVSGVGLPAIGKGFDVGGGLHSITPMDWASTGINVGLGAFALKGLVFKPNTPEIVTPKVAEYKAYEPSFGETFGVEPGLRINNPIPVSEGAASVLQTPEELAALDRYAIPKTIDTSMAKPNIEDVLFKPETQTFNFEPINSKLVNPPITDSFASTFGLEPGINLPKPTEILNPVSDLGKYPTSTPAKIAPNKMNLGAYPDYNAAAMPEVYNPAAGMSKIELGEQPLYPSQKPYGGWDEFAKPETYNPVVEAPDFTIKPTIESDAITKIRIVNRPEGSTVPNIFAEAFGEKPPTISSASINKLLSDNFPQVDELGGDWSPYSYREPKTPGGELLKGGGGTRTAVKETTRMTPEQAAKEDLSRTGEANNEVSYPRYQIDIQGNIIPTSSSYFRFIPTIKYSPNYNPIPGFTPETNPLINPVIAPITIPQTVPWITPGITPEFAPYTGVEVITNPDVITSPVIQPYLPDSSPYINPYPGIVTGTEPIVAPAPGTQPITGIHDVPVIVKEPTPITEPKPITVSLPKPIEGIKPPIQPPNIPPPIPEIPKITPAKIIIPPGLGAPSGSGGGGAAGIPLSKRKKMLYGKIPKLVVYTPTWDFENGAQPMSLLNRHETVVTPSQKTKAGATEDLGQGFYRGRRTLSVDNGRLL